MDIKNPIDKTQAIAWFVMGMDYLIGPSYTGWQFATVATVLLAVYKWADSEGWYIPVSTRRIVLLAMNIMCLFWMLSIVLFFEDRSAASELLHKVCMLVIVVTMFLKASGGGGGGGGKTIRASLWGHDAGNSFVGDVVEE